MDKNTKRRLAFLCISLFSTSFLKTMEEKIEKSGQIQEADKSKMSKSQKKRASRKRAIERRQAQELKEEDEQRLEVRKKNAQFKEADIEKLKDATKLENIRKILNPTQNNNDYIRNLQNINKLLSFRNLILEGFKALLKYSQDLVETATDESYCCFSISKDGQGICGHEKDECGETKILLTKEGISFANKLIAPMLSSENFWNNTKEIERFFSESNQSIENPNKEVVLVAKYVKNRILNQWFHEKVKDCYRELLSFLSNLNFGEQYQRGKAEDILFDIDIDNGIKKIINGWLKKNKLFKVVGILIPDLIDVTESFYYFEEELGSQIEDGDNLYHHDFASIINDNLAGIIGFYQGLEPVYKELYETIRQESQEDKIGFITDYIIEDKKEESAGSPKPKKKKRSRRKKNQKTFAEKEEMREEKAKEEQVQSTDELASNISEMSSKEIDIPKIQEYLKLPRYDERILNWFNPEYIEANKPDDSSIFYHTYCALADFVIRKHGYKQFERNSNPAETDTAFYMACRLINKNGDVKEKVLKISFLENGLCYHRGPIDITTVPDIFAKFKDSISKFDFPDLLTEQTIIKKKIELDDDLPNAHIYKDLEYKEGNYHFEIYDSVHEITFILFKHLINKPNSESTLI